MRSAVERFPAVITRLISWVTRRELYTGSGSSGRPGISARRGTLRPPLRAVLGTALLAVGDARRVERGPDHLVAEAREVLDAAAADQHDGVLLEVVALAGDVRADLHRVGQPDARDLPKRGVRLLRRGRVHARADAPLLRRAAQGRRLHLRLRRSTTFPHELVDSRYGNSSRGLTGLHTTKAGGATPPPTRG